MNIIEFGNEIISKIKGVHKKYGNIPVIEIDNRRGPLYDNCWVTDDCSLTLIVKTKAELLSQVENMKFDNVDFSGCDLDSLGDNDPVCVIDADGILF